MISCHVKNGMNVGQTYTSPLCYASLTLQSATPMKAIVIGACERSPSPWRLTIGAGVGGTATAARLAHAGYVVDVYEKNAYMGGRCSLIEHEGWRFDQGPSLLLLPRLFRQIYEELGTSLDQHVELVQASPNYIVHFHDGERIVLSSDRALLAKEVERFEGREGVDGLEGFLRYVRPRRKRLELIIARQGPTPACPTISSSPRPSLPFYRCSSPTFSSMSSRCTLSRRSTGGLQSTSAQSD